MQEDDIFYFRKEIDYLHKMREQFVQKYPKLAPFLSYNSNDPDVERIIESLAVLSAKIHKELDYSLPSIAESLMNILMPNLSNALPSFCVQKFAHAAKSKEHKIFIPAQSQVYSKPIGSLKCEFRTAYDVCVYPLKVSDVSMGSEGRNHTLTLSLEITQDDVSFADLELTSLSFYLGDEVYTSNTLLLWLLRYVKEIILFSHEDGQSYKIGADCIEPMGLKESEFLLRYDDSGFSAFALLQELLFMTEKFHFIKLNGLNAAADFQGRGMDIKFVFDKELPKDCLPNTHHFCLFATPVFNLFPAQAEPILLDHQRDSYRIFVDRSNLDAYYVVNVARVKAHSSDAGRRVLKNYHSFERFEFLQGNRDFYAIANRQDSQGRHYKEISFYAQSRNKETVSIDVFCSNGDMPLRLGRGDVSEYTGHKDIVTSNITLPTPSRYAQINAQTMSHLTSTLSFSYQSIIYRENFLNILNTYASVFAQNPDLLAILSNALQDIQSSTIYRTRGFMTQRGTLATMYIDDSKFYCLGEVYKIGLVFSHFFASFASINSFCELEIVCVASECRFSYPTIYGKKAIV